MKEEETKYLIEEMARDYRAIWDQLGFIKEEHAHARASNGLMVEMCKRKDYIKGYIETHPSASNSAVPSQKPTAPPPTPQPNRIDTPPYDAETKRWNYCEVHPDEQIKQFSEDKKRYYYACFKCDEFLQVDGTRKPMGGKK